MRNVVWSVGMAILTMLGLFVFMTTLRILPYMIGFYIFTFVSIRAAREIIKENKEWREKGIRR